MQENGQKCKKSNVNLYTKKQPVLGCVFEIFYLFLIQKYQLGINEFQCNFVQEKGQKCKKSDTHLYTKKQAVIACLSKFLLNFLISNALFPYNNFFLIMAGPTRACEGMPFRH